MSRLTPSDSEALSKLESIARWMDSQFRIPGTSIRFGLDSVLGLIPGIGDTITLASTIYILGYAHRMGVPFHVKVRMAWNALIDWLIGLVPLFGDIFDVGWKANHKNVALLKKHFEKKTV